ncbi:DnaJ domain-containing protein [Biscogniauxia marginata]|nr:DnaJ domain-containing protein [Biscogniauxia marginata]
MASPKKPVDYYTILGVSRSVDSANLKAAYRRLALVKHPDKNPDNPNATADFQMIGSAYTTLADPELRRTYDKENPSVGKIKIKINLKKTNPRSDTSTGKANIRTNMKRAKPPTRVPFVLPNSLYITLVNRKRPSMTQSRPPRCQAREEEITSSQG